MTVVIGLSDTQWYHLRTFVSSLLMNVNEVDVHQRVVLDWQFNTMTLSTRRCEAWLLLSTASFSLRDMIVFKTVPAVTSTHSHFDLWPLVGWTLFQLVTLFLCGRGFEYCQFLLVVDDSFYGLVGIFLLPLHPYRMSAYTGLLQCWQLPVLQPINMNLIVFILHSIVRSCSIIFCQLCLYVAQHSSSV